MKLFKCKTLKSKSRKKAISSISPIKWIKRYDPGGRWNNDPPTHSWSLRITSRYSAHVVKNSTYKEYHWVLRDDGFCRNIVLPSYLCKKKSFKQSKERAMLAHILWMTVKLLKNTSDPMIVNGAFHGV